MRIRDCLGHLLSAHRDPKNLEHSKAMFLEKSLQIAVSTCSQNAVVFGLKCQQLRLNFI
jgi:hypothetical protein